MRTTLDIPEDLMNELLTVLKVKRKNRAVRTAIEEFVRRRKKERLLALGGKVDIVDVSRELEEAESGER